MVETKSKAAVAADIQRKGFTKKKFVILSMCSRMRKRERERKTRFFN